MEVIPVRPRRILKKSSREIAKRKADELISKPALNGYLTFACAIRCDGSEVHIQFAKTEAWEILPEHLARDLANLVAQAASIHFNSKRNILQSLKRLQERKKK